MMRWLILTALWLASSVYAQEFRSPDGKLVALVQAVGVKKFGRGESCIEIRSSMGLVKSRTCYQSDDGEHGAGLERAAWTPDSQFFVYSTSSSGGHQPWAFPTYFYSALDDRTRLLDDFVGPITEPEFSVMVPDVVSTVTWGSVTARKEERHVTNLRSLVRERK